MGKKARKPPSAAKEKAVRKAAKGAAKVARREARALPGEDDIDAILERIKREEAKKVEVVVEDGVDAPTPRCNATLTANPSKEKELLLFGGEFYNGDKLELRAKIQRMHGNKSMILLQTYVYGDLYKYDTDRATWSKVSSPNSPPPRSAHQVVAWKGSLFVFGGGFTSPNQERFHHYKDLWKLDLAANAWEQLQVKGGPSARSGHRMALYKHKLVVFGGFYDTLREVRYYNDLFILDLDEYKWSEVKPKLGAAWPSPRSAFQLAVFQDEILLYGGYFKDHGGAEKGKSEKGVVYTDMWTLDPRTWAWDKVKRVGTPPGPRAGFSQAVHKKRAIVFGGVVDVESKEDVIRSTFLNEMYTFAVDARRWYRFELRKPKGSKSRADRSTQLEENEDEEEEEEAGLGQVKDAAVDLGKEGEREGDKEEEEGKEEEERKGRMSRKLRYKMRVRLRDSEVKRAAEISEVGDVDEDLYDAAREAHSESGPEERGDEGLACVSRPMEGQEADEDDTAAESASTAAHVIASCLKGVRGTGEGQGDGTDPTCQTTLVDDIQSLQVAGAADDEQDKLMITARFAESPSPEIKDTYSNILEEGVGPCGRINASLVVIGNTLYLYGGIVEIGEQEITLDDLYSLDLNKMTSWNCLNEASHSEWVNASDGDDEEDEDGSDASEGDEEGRDDEEDKYSSEEEGPIAGHDSSRNGGEQASTSCEGDALSVAERAAALLRGEGKRLGRKERKMEIDRIRAELGLADSARTPQPGESLRDFFVRTSIHWQRAAFEETQHTGKELRRDGFDLCASRYTELRPVLDELERLEAEQKEEEDAAVAKMKAKKPTTSRR